MSIRGSRALYVVAMLLAGCASRKTPPPPPRTPEPVNAKASLSAGATINPDPSGRASPVVVRLYQLRSDSGFIGAPFFALYDQEKETLGADLIRRDERTVLPGQMLELTVAVSPDTRFLGALAGFRDIQSGRWRAMTTVPSLTDPKKAAKRSISVRIEGEMIDVSIDK